MKLLLKRQEIAVKLSTFSRSLALLAVPAVLAAAGCQKKAADGVPTASVTDLNSPAPMAAYSLRPGANGSADL